MKDSLRVTVVFLTLWLVAEALPKHGNYKGIRIAVNGSSVNGNSSCSNLAMISDSPIRVSLRSAQFKNNRINTTVEIITELYESQCETADRKDCLATANSQLHKIASNTQILTLANEVSTIHFKMTNTTYISAKETRDGNTKPESGTAKAAPKTDKSGTTKTDPKSGTTNADPQTKAGQENGAGQESDKTKIDSTTDATKTTDESVLNNTVDKSKTNWLTFTTNNSGIYVIKIFVKNMEKKEGSYNLTFDVEMKNRFGYISLVDYPALITYGILLVVYIFYAFAWLIMMGCHYKDLLRLQFWIVGVILLGFLEKIFFVAEYGSANEGHESSGLIYVAEGVSAGKRALARVLIIIVCEGFGIVKPRLGPTLTKVLVVGGIYFVAAFIDGITRASKATTDGFDLTIIVTTILLFLIDIGIVYWIFSALVNTRRALRVRKNIVKLSLYNHLAYALIATVIASVAFTVWDFIAISKEDCTSDWREMWLNDCFWHMLFCFVLLVLMIIWRPSANNLRFAYTQVSFESDEEELEQGANKNFDTIKMRTVSQPDGPKPVLMSQEAEDDLKWAEENLPTTIIDKTLPAILDSEEEVMTTKFESSKMN